MKTLLLSLLTLALAANLSFAGAYRHIVLFKFKESATAEQITELEEAFATLPKKIETIREFEWGTNVSPEGKDKGFTHCFLVTFEDKEGLEVYLPHPTHKEFVKLVRPLVEDVTVIDYVAK